METALKRRTIRKYSTRDIAPEVLNDLLKTACQASTCGNMQLYSIIVTRNKTQKEALSPHHFNQPMIKNAPVVLTFCADLNRFSTWCKQREAKPGYNNFQSFMNATMDTLIVAQTFAMLAEEQGLGICYLGTTTYNPKEIIQTLNLPKLVFPITTLTVGYPDENPAQSDRLPIEAIIHQETYQEYTPEHINQYFSYKESLPENKQFVAENQKSSLAQVFTDIRYTRKDNEAISEKLFNVLKEQNLL